MTESDIRNIYFDSEKAEEIIETHISWVIITERHVYKLKKPVKFSFVDFSAPEKRKFYCEEELRLNQRLTSGMYISIMGIRRSNGNLIITEDLDGAIDFAVKMTRQNLELQMHLMLEKNLVSPEHIHALSDIISKFHKSLAPIYIPFNQLSLKDTFNDLESVFPFVFRELGKQYSDVISHAISYSDNFIQLHHKEFEERIERGMIRDCHGDLHSGNIFLSDPPVIFDCIEFNPAFRQIDLLYEIAFFCMDLDSFGREDLKNLFLLNYKRLFPEVTERETDRLIFIYYKLLRANIKVKVLALKLSGEHFSKDDLHDTDELKRYIRLMQRYLSQLKAELIS